MVDKNLLNEYIKYFGDEPPFPPEHIMKTLVDMKRDGIYDEKMEEFESFKDEVVGQIEDVSGEKLSLDHPLLIRPSTILDRVLSFACAIL